MDVCNYLWDSGCSYWYCYTINRIVIVCEWLRGVYLPMSGLRTAALYFLIALALSVLVQAAIADENTTANITENGSYVTVEMPQLDYNFTHFLYAGTYRIAQGSDVYINDTIDISGMGWGDGFAWYGRYGEYDTAQYVYEFSDYRKQTLMNFYIDPAIFSSRLGMWYQYYGNTTEPNGNLAAFYVRDRHLNTTMTYSNGTIMNTTIYVKGATTPLVVPQPSVLPEVHVADYLLAIGDPLIVKTYGPAQVWIFGRVDKTYGSTPNDNMTFDAKTFENFEPGTYTMIVQHPGNNTDFDVRFNNNTLEYKTGWNGVQNADVSALQPRMVMSQLLQLLGKTDDDYLTYSLEIDQPDIRVTSIDDIWLKSKIDEFHIDNSADVTFKDIRGYTNFQNGTNLTVSLDKDYNGYGKARFTTYAQTWRSANGNRTMFQAYVPIIWDTIPLGMHTITVSGPGASTDANFPVELMPADSYRPNTTLKYTGDANPWKPNLTTPTPLPAITITIPVTILVPVTPAPEVVYEQQKKAQGDIIGGWATMIGFSLAALVVLFFGGRYLLSVWRRL